MGIRVVVQLCYTEGTGTFITKFLEIGAAEQFGQGLIVVVQGKGQRLLLGFQVWAEMLIRAWMDTRQGRTIGLDVTLVVALWVWTLVNIMRSVFGVRALTSCICCR